MRAQDAITFLIERIDEQALRDGVQLSDVERRMLRWSEVEPGGINDPALNDQFEAECDSDEYEEKISNLLSRAYEHDKNDSRRNSQWDDAKNALKGHDYYLLVMLQL